MNSRILHSIAVFILLTVLCTGISTPAQSAEEAQQVLLLRKVFAAQVFEWSTIFEENRKLLDDSFFQRIEERIRWDLDNGQVEDAIRFAYAGDIAASVVKRKTDLRLQLSQLFRKIGNTTTALDMVSNILMTDPKNVDAKFYKASLLQDSKLFEEAYPLYQELIDQNARVADSYFRIGLIDLLRQDIVLAQEHFKNAVKADPKHEGARKELAKIDNIISSATFVPKTPNGQSGVPFGSMKTNLSAPAVEKPNTVDLMTNAQTARSGGRLDRAIELYNQVVKINPKQTEAYVLLGTALYQQAQLSEAIENLEIAVALSPVNAEALRYLGYCYERRYDNKKDNADLLSAKDRFTKSQALHPKNAFIDLDMKRINAKCSSLAK